VRLSGKRAIFRDFENRQPGLLRRYLIAVERSRFSKAVEDIPHAGSEHTGALQLGLRILDLALLQQGVAQAKYSLRISRLLVRSNLPPSFIASKGVSR
jgi:hypothetical protein